jgi:hypothetical protein
MTEQWLKAIETMINGFWKVLTTCNPLDSQLEVPQARRAPKAKGRPGAGKRRRHYVTRPHHHKRH